jgi:serine phosphatase RsbU (regulator of sigma subunit)
LRYRLTIGRKIGIGFGILIFLTLINFVLTLDTVNKSTDLNNSINTIYTPSVQLFERLNYMLLRSNKYIENWVTRDVEAPSSPVKEPLRKIINVEYPALKKQIREMSKYWPEKDQKRVDTLIIKIDALFHDHYSQVMNGLDSYESYQDPIIKFMWTDYVYAATIPVEIEQIQKELSAIIEYERNNADKASNQMVDSFDVLQTVVRNSGVLLVIGGILIAFFTIRTIVKPIKELQGVIQLLGKGIFPKENIIKGNDEIGEMSIALENLINGLKRTTDFSREIGNSNFKAHYDPLSAQDVLGHALLKMRGQLKESEQRLEAKVLERTQEVIKQNKEIQKQRDEIEEKNKSLQVLYQNVTDSIRYAKRIQQSILPPIEVVREALPESFVLYKPKDIVSGDFYWMDDSMKDITWIAAVDCTGHGVPGAFMSIIGYNSLNQIIVENKPSVSAAAVLNRLKALVSQSLRQTQDGESSKDGMDIALCKIDKKKKVIEFAGAFNPLLYIKTSQSNELLEVKGNKFPIGIYMQEEDEQFTNHQIKIDEGDSFYIFSDGYADQIGGPRNKKFLIKNFRNLLCEIHTESMERQRQILNETLEEWKGEHDQVDDILVIGFRL